MHNKVLIFENQISEVVNAFKAINLLFFGNKLEYKFCTTSQEIDNIENLNKYDLIIIDIDLSINSKKDGFGIIKDAFQLNENILNRIFVLTGSTKVRVKLDELSFTTIPVIKKPIDIDELASAMEKIIGKLQNGEK